MDESWRMRMGIPRTTIQRRHSVEGDHTNSSSSSLLRPTRRSTSVFSTNATAVLDGTFGAEDFTDVFGGPPRSVLSRKFSSEFNFYEEIFRPPEFASPATTKGGRSLPAFRIPARNEGFYGDVFGAATAAEEGGGGGGSGGGRRSRERSRQMSKSKSKSKSNSSSVLSSEELSPLRQVTGDDVALSYFASKLRPLNVPSRWNSGAMMQEKQPMKHTMPSFPCNHSSFMDNQSVATEHSDPYNRSSYYGFARHVSSPETISIEPNSYRSVKIVDDLELNSPSTPASSLCQESEAKVRIHDNGMRREEMEQEEEEEDEVMSSYVIEITSDHREGTCEEVSIDEAIAWAKERYQTSSSDRQHEKEHSDETTEGIWC